MNANAMVAAGAIGQCGGLMGVLHIALHIDGAHNDGMIAGQWRPGNFPEHPGQGRKRTFQRRHLPGFTSVQADIDLADAAIAGEGDAGDIGCAMGAHGRAVERRIDARGQQHRRGIAPAALLPVALEIVVDHLDPGQPFDVFHA
ncbi:MAG TPA: hypothetical protein VFV38_36015, partial [Ktedonobacteraceae bacterium]|nr:hypothetical protein [Ktedonobacteraceae bacterium]